MATKYAGYATRGRTSNTAPQMTTNTAPDGDPGGGTGGGGDWFAANAPRNTSDPFAGMFDPRLQDPAWANTPEGLAEANRQNDFLQGLQERVGTGPQNGDVKGWFLRVTQGMPTTPAFLKFLEPILQAHGISLAPNAAGVNGKIRLPSGQVVDVLQNAGSGGSAWQWLDGPGGGAGSGGPMPSATDQFSGPPPDYTSTPWTGGAYTPPPLPTELQTPFQAPTQAELETSPGYLARLDAGRRGRERGYAARGTIFNGGTLVALDREAQTQASNEYGNLYGQRLNSRQQNYGEYQGAVGVGQNTYQNRYNAWGDENARTLQQYQTRVGTRRNWENDLWGRYRDLRDGGLRAAGA